MKFTAMVALAMTGLTAQAAAMKQSQISIYVQNNAHVPVRELDQAEILAATMFASVHIEIDWREGQPSAAGEPIAIELAANVPKTEKPGALACAYYDESIIVVFWDRMEHAANPAPLLAHVLVHEITHILEGVSRHSQSGIMKERWNAADMDLIQFHKLKLAFAAEDVYLIQLGLKKREAMDRRVPHSVASE